MANKGMISKGARQAYQQAIYKQQRRAARNRKLYDKIPAQGKAAAAGKWVTNKTQAKKDLTARTGYTDGVSSTWVKERAKNKTRIGNRFGVESYYKKYRKK